MAIDFSEIAQVDATAQADLVATGQATASELVEAAIQRIERLNPQINCVIYPRFDLARDEAAKLRGHPVRPIFSGVPFLLKDLSETVAGEPMSWGWKPLKDAQVRARSTANVAARFHAAGLITLGRTTVPEWGPSIATETRAWGATRNP
ncbi:MAG: amidase family protein, partial [Candidatus Binataceae bacterium]